MSSPGYFFIPENYVDVLREREWNALFDGVAPNEIVGQEHIPERELIKIELEGPEVEPETEYMIAFTYEDDGTVNVQLDEVHSPDHMLQLAT